MHALRGWFMEKWLCWASAGIAGLFLFLFVLDFILSLADVKSFLPFGGLSLFVDVVCALAAGLLLYLSLDAMRDLR